MRLILLDIFASRRSFYPLSFSRPLWELRCGIGTLREKLQAACGVNSVAGFVSDYLADTCRESSSFAINDLSALRGDDLLVVNARVKASALPALMALPKHVMATTEDGELLFAHLSQAAAEADSRSSIQNFVRYLPGLLTRTEPPPCWNYTWELVDANAAEITADFQRLGLGGQCHGVESQVIVRGSPRDVCLAPSAQVSPMAVLDATAGPIFIDHGAMVEPFTHIVGPCYVGPYAKLLGARCRGGNTIGPYCRVGGEIEASILQGYSNKCHDGFLGHSYVGQWVNLGAMTCNSDLRNDYAPVSVKLDERGPISTGLLKFGSVIGDHAKTSIGTLLNTGACVGAFAMLVTNGELAPRYIPSFSTFLRGRLGEGFKREQLYATARTVMGRRECTWTPAAESMWNAVYEMTAPHRELEEKPKHAA